MKTNLTHQERKLIQAISKKSNIRDDDWLINHLYEEYQRVYKKPFNG